MSIKLDAEEARKILDAMRDALGGWRYIRDSHGDLYGVGWDRVELKLKSAIASITDPACEKVEPSNSEMGAYLESLLPYADDANAKDVAGYRIGFRIGWNARAGLSPLTTEPTA